MLDKPDIALDTQVGIKLDSTLRETLIERARANGRSLSGEIRFRLQKSLEDSSEAPRAA